MDFLLTILAIFIVAMAALIWLCDVMTSDNNFYHGEYNNKDGDWVVIKAKHKKEEALKKKRFDVKDWTKQTKEKDND